MTFNIRRNQGRAVLHATLDHLLADQKYGVNEMKRFFCLILGHYWLDEKEFVTCRRCQSVKAKRELAPHEWVRISGRRR